MNSNNVKELAFVTITMRPLDSTDATKADFEVQMTNTNTAGIKVVKFDFKPDPRLGRKDFPINRDRAESLVIHAMEELIGGLPDDVRNEYDVHFATADVFDRLLVVASVKVKDFSMLPDPIESPFGKIEFIAKPTKETFTSLSDLPSMAFTAMRKSTCDVMPIYIRLTPVTDIPAMSDGFGMGYGRMGNIPEGKKVVDRTQAILKMAGQLKDALDPYDMEITPENTAPRARFDGSNPQPEPDRRTFVQAAYAQLAENIVQRMYEIDYGNDVADFTMSKGGRIQREEDKDHSFVMSLHLGGYYVLHILSGEYLKTRRPVQHSYAGYPRGDVHGNLLFNGEKRGFSIGFAAHNRYAVPMNLKELMDPPKLLAVINKAVERHLQPLNLAQFIDTSTIQFDQDDGK